MNKFKRILSLICIVAMVMTNTYLPAFASDNSGYIIDMSDNFVKSKFVKYSVFETAYGIGGKKATDQSLHLVDNGSDMYFESGAVSIDKSKVYSLKMNVFVETDMRIFFLATRQHKKAN